MQSEAVLRRHLLVERDSPPSPWDWRRSLPAFALVLLIAFAAGPVARDWIEASVAREARAQLDAAGFRWAQLAVSGQRITLSGEAPGAAEGERALAAARAVTCPTLLGRRLCAVSVTGHFTLAPSPAAALPGDSSIAPATLAPTPGAAPSAAAAPAAARACERSLAHVLAGEQIRFARDSATISASSGRLLDRLAESARGCPGVIRIEGYTDAAGRPASNRALSRARAAAVRAALIARGLPAERLEARGYGSARPVASNHTARGRARNRRIEFHALPSRA
jgi:outer membrane protein OmpA-like peptidoglycan-associated protein